MSNTLESKLNYIEKWYLNGQEAKGPLWSLSKSNKELIQQNKTNTNIEQSFELLKEAIVGSYETGGVTAFKVSLFKNINDGKPQILDVKIATDNSGIGAIKSKSSGDGAFDKLLEEKDKNTKLEIDSILKMRELEIENAILKSKEASNFERFENLLIRLLETPTVSKVGEAISLGIGKKMFAPAGQAAKIGTLTGTEEPKKESRKMETTDLKAIFLIVERMEKLTDKPIDKVLGDLVDYMENNPKQAKTALSIVGIEL